MQQTRSIILCLSLCFLASCAASADDGNTTTIPAGERATFERDDVMMVFPEGVLADDLSIEVENFDYFSGPEKEATVDRLLRESRTLGFEVGDHLHGLQIAPTKQLRLSQHTFSDSIYVRLPWIGLHVRDLETSEVKLNPAGSAYPIFIKEPGTENVRWLTRLDGSRVYGFPVRGEDREYEYIEFVTDTFCGEGCTLPPRQQALSSQKGSWTTRSFALENEEVYYAFDVMAGAFTWDEFPAAWDDTAKMYMLSPMALDDSMRAGYRELWADDEDRRQAYIHVLWAVVSLFGEPARADEAIEQLMQGWREASENAGDIENILDKLEAIEELAEYRGVVIERLKSGDFIDILRKLGPVLVIIDCAEAIMPFFFEHAFAIDRDIRQLADLQEIYKNSELHGNDVAFQRALLEFDAYITGVTAGVFDEYGATQELAMNCVVGPLFELIEAFSAGMGWIAGWFGERAYEAHENYYLGSVLLTLWREGGLETWLDEKGVPWRVASKLECDTDGKNCVDLGAWEDPYAVADEYNMWCDESTRFLVAFKTLANLNEFTHQAEAYFIAKQRRNSSRLLATLPGKQAFDRWNHAEHISKELYRLRKARYEGIIDAVNNPPGKPDCPPPKTNPTRNPTTNDVPGF